MFQRRHFEAIARVMQQTKPLVAVDTDILQWARDRDALCILFTRENDRFNRDRFIRACEPGANVKARTK